MNLVLWGLLLLLCWLLAWRVIYALTGFHVGYVTINNGIALNRVHFVLRRVRVSALSVRFRLWGNTSKLIVADLRFETLGPPPAPERPLRPRSVSSSPISIYPAKTAKKWLVSGLLRILPALDVELKNTTVVHRKLAATLHSLLLTLKGTRSSHVKNTYDYALQVSALRFDGNLAASDAQVPCSVGSFALQVYFLLDTKTGRLSNVIVRMHLDNLQALAFQLLKSLILSSTVATPPLPPPPLRTRNLSSNTLQKELDTIAHLHNRIFECIQEVSINIANTTVDGICLVPASNCSLTEYLDSPHPDLSVAVEVKSISVHLDRVTDKSSGFEVLFNAPIDRPFELTSALLLLKFSFVQRKVDPKTNLSYDSKDEFLNLPNFSFTFKTNIADHLANGYGFKNCVLELFSSASSPILDLDAHHYALLAFNYAVLVKLFTLRKLRKQRTARENEDSITDSEDDDTKVAESDQESPSRHPYKSSPDASRQMFDRIIRLLDDYYPRLDIKLTVEQPRTVLRHKNEKLNKTQILMLSYSMMVLHVSTTLSDDYDAKCQFLHPCLSFSEKELHQNESGNREEFCGFSSTKLLCQLLKNFRVKSIVALDGGFIHLTKPDVLIGINSIINEATKLTVANLKLGVINHHFKSEIMREIKLHGNSSHSHKSSGQMSAERLFSSLPSWLVSADFRCDNVDINLGSTSPLLPPVLISSLSKVSDGSFIDTASSLKLQFTELWVGLDNSTTEYSDTTSTISSASLDTLASDETERVYWKIASQLKGFRVSVLEDGDGSVSTIVSVPYLKSSVSAKQLKEKNAVFFALDLDEILANIDRHKVFIILGLAHLIIYTIVRPLKKFLKNLNKDMAALRAREQNGASFDASEFIICDAHLNKANLIFELSDEFRLRSQIFDIEAHRENVVTTVSSKFLRILVNSPLVAGFWDRILCVDSFLLTIDPTADQIAILETPAIKITQPHRFIVYKLFDNLSVFVKIIKHLVICLKSEDKATVVYPTESKPLSIPPIKLKSKKLSFAIEDDPFECELNMIYQLGLVEQKKRLELERIFQEEASANKESEEELEKRFVDLQKLIEVLWIRKVNAYMSKLTEEIVANKKYLFGSEIDIPESENNKVTTYMRNAPLLFVIFSGLDLDVSKMNFPLEDVPKFIHKYGQGVPEDTKYNLMIPSYIKLGVEEVRMHMRDYPLPLLYLPYAVDENGRGKALNMEGNLLICEALILDKEHLRRLSVQLTDIKDDGSELNNKFDKLIIEKSMSTVKLYTDLDILFGSTAPSRFVWGQSYQFGIQQIMLNVDQFSKPPVDPSPKLGFWDKMRLVMHGCCTIRTAKQASIEVAFKGGRDPYDLFSDSSGFVLAFKKNVVWKVNAHDESLKFFEILADQVSWYIPKYLSVPLVCWVRESSKPTFLPSVKEMIASIHGYYLLDKPSGTDFLAYNRGSNECEKRVVELSGGVNFTVGFLLQRNNPDGEGVTEEGMPHYEVKLCNPEYTKKGHDSYKGFRSDRLHMAISLIAHTKKSYNTIHLSPGTFKQFFSWWTMFRGNMMLPIRRGKLFQEVKSATKFSEHLFTNKFLFHIKNLFIGHIYRDENFEHDDDILECNGLRAKVENFLVDLHQRKEERVDVHDDLSRHKKIMKMAFNLGEVVLSQIDLRSIHVKFHRDLYRPNGDEKEQPKLKFKVYDRDYRWYDPRDYDEAFAPPSGTVKLVEILPFLFSNKFSYIRDTTDVGGNNGWGAEKTHDCKLHETDVYSTQISIYEERLNYLKGYKKNGTQEDANIGDLKLDDRIQTLENLVKEAQRQKRKSARHGSVVSKDSIAHEKFHNRFVLISMFLKWNEQVRNNFMKYLYFVELKSNFRKYLSYEFISMLEDIIDKNGGGDDIRSLGTSTMANQSVRQLDNCLNQFQKSLQRFEKFDKIMRDVGNNEQIQEDFKIEIISPQIQLHTNEVKDSVVIITAPELESKIFSVIMKKDSQMPMNAKQLEKRYGVLLHNASVMVIDKQNVDLKNLILEKSPYGTTTNWPPFLGIEVCRDKSLTLKNDSLIDEMSLMLSFVQVVALGSSIEQMEGVSEGETKDTTEKSDSSENRLCIDVPKLVINCTSKQYFTLYVTVLSLLVYVEPLKLELRERISKLKFSIDFQDFNALHQRLVDLHEYLGIMQPLLDNYSFRLDGFMDNEALNDYLLVQSEQEQSRTEIFLMLQTLFTGDVFDDQSSQAVEEWRIAADEIVLHMLKDDRTPILDLTIQEGVCKRLIKDDGSNDNRIEIKSIDGVTLLPDAYYEKFLEPINVPRDDYLICVDWSMNRSIGGIRIIENFEISSLPLNVRMDEETGRLLMRFIFYTEDDDQITESPIMKITEANGGSDKDSELGEEDRGERSEDSSDNSGDELNQSDGKSAVSSRKVQRKSSFKNSSASSGSDGFADFDKDVEQMIHRSKEYLSIVSFTSRSFEVMISLKLKNGYKRLLNVTNFLLKVPEWHINMQVMSFLDVANMLKKLVIRALLDHSGLLLRNKLSKKLQRDKRLQRLQLN